ncbi:MAG: hypothetical protein QOD63_54, partial [Actinomycetota bacterium]|nr:hypothetical protein [Actinomycetota bacterium]
RQWRWRRQRALGDLLERHETAAELARPEWVPARKEDAACCLAHRDEYGRFPIGYCGPLCSRRPPGIRAGVR